MGHIKMDCKNISNKKKHKPYISLQFITWSLPHLLTVVSLQRRVEWPWTFLKNFQKERKEPLEQNLDFIFFMLFL